MTASNSFFSPSCKSSITLKALKIGQSVETEKRFLLQLHLFPTCRDERVKSAEAKASAKHATCRGVDGEWYTVVKFIKSIRLFPQWNLV